MRCSRALRLRSSSNLLALSFSSSADDIEGFWVSGLEAMNAFIFFYNTTVKPRTLLHLQSQYFYCSIILKNVIVE